MPWRSGNPRALQSVQFALLVMSTIWGLDYLVPPPDPNEVLNYIERHSLLSLPVWGGVMVALGLIGIVSEILIKFYDRRFWFGVWFVHYLFAGLFGALSIGSAAGVLLENEGLYGFRAPFTWLFIAGTHLAFAQRLQPLPDKLAPDVVQAVKEKLHDDLE